MKYRYLYFEYRNRNRDIANSTTDIKKKTSKRLCDITNLIL